MATIIHLNMAETPVVSRTQIKKKKHTKSLCIALSHFRLLIQNRLLVRKKCSSKYLLPFERHPGSIPEPVRGSI